MLFLKTEPADLLGWETAKVATLSGQGFQRVAAVVLGLRVQPSLPGEQAQPLESIGHVQALHAASLTLRDNPRKAATLYPPCLTAEPEPHVAVYPSM